MGFDLNGLKAKSEKGEYFRANCWWWRKLWDFTYSICQDIIKEEEYQSGHMNDGQKFDKIRTDAIVARIQSAIDSGKAATYATETKTRIKEAKKNNKGLKAGNKGYDWAEAYPFTVENLKDFQKFLKESGGFEIY